MLSTLSLPGKVAGSCVENHKDDCEHGVVVVVEGPPSMERDCLL